MTTSTRTAAAAIAATLAAIAAPAGPAHAGEAGYLARLAIDYGYTIAPDTEIPALRAGYLICDKLREGTPRANLADSVFWAIPNATREQAEGMAFAAQEELCPDTRE